MDPTIQALAPWDDQLTVTTIVSVALVAAATAGVLVAAFRAKSALVGALLAGSAVPGLVGLSLCYWWSPRGLGIDANAVRIERPSGPILLPRSEIVEVKALSDRVELDRVFGNAGLFGYYGQYQAPVLGTVELYATRRTGRVLIKTSARTLVVTPARPDEFLGALASRARQLGE